MSPAAQAAVVGGIAGGAVGGLFTVLGVLLGLFGERWVRWLGKVRYETHWNFYRGKDYPDGTFVVERRLRVTFLNKKDVDVNVLDMNVLFYRNGKALWGEAHPNVEFVDDKDERSPLTSLNLPPRKPVSRTISVYYDKDNAPRLWGLHRAEKATFVATLDGARDIKETLTPTWSAAPPGEHA